jgi:hypothetical protein
MKEKQITKLTHDEINENRIHLNLLFLFIVPFRTLQFHQKIIQTAVVASVVTSLLKKIFYFVV